jgi:hypothetical protein
VGAPPYVEDGDSGVPSTPGYTCEQLADPAFVCRGPAAGQPCDPDTASNDPLFCASGLSCCSDGGAAPYTCRAPQVGNICIL